MNRTEYVYNALGKLSKAIYPGDLTMPSNTITYQYDVMGNLKYQQDSTGKVDLYTYDNQGRALSHTQQKQDGTQAITTSTRYDKNGNKRFETDGNGVTKESIYDSLNRIAQTNITVGGVIQATTYAYDANGNQTGITDWRGNTSTNTYDPLNRLVEKKDPYVTIQKLEYNKNSVQVKSYDALGNLTQYTYDKNNRLINTIDPENHTTSQSYDNVGNIHTKTDGRNITTTYNYDEFGRLSSVVDPKSETTSYTYDLNGNMLTQTDGNGNTTIYEYNVANKPTKKIDQGGRTGAPGNYTYISAKTESYTYDADGSILTKTDRNGETTTYTYDIHGRLLSQVVGSSSISYTYDNNGNQLTMTDGTGTTTRTYDEENRVLTKTVPYMGIMTFKYDILTGVSAGYEKETSTDPNGNVTEKVYDKAGRLSTVTADGKTTTYSYFDNGNRQSVVYPDGSREDYTYYRDNLNRTLTNKKGDGSIIDSYSYTYDAAHNQTSKTDGKGTTYFTYDSLNRLETVTEPNGKVTSYTFDRAGNRATETVTAGVSTVVTLYNYNEQNRLTSTTTTSGGGVSTEVAYQYDNNGNMVSKSESDVKPADPLATGIFSVYKVGSSTDTSTSFYEYNELNQLVRTVSGSQVTMEEYNGDGLRVSKTVNGQTTRYLYESDKVVLEEDGSGNVTARNVYGTNLLSRTVDGQALYYMYNGHADVTALLDANGQVAASYYYDAFGNPVETSGNVNNPYRYAGYRYDSETGLYYLNARYYDATTARFLSEDTYSGDPNDPLSLNLYTYCNNDPIMYDDPTGHHATGEVLSYNQTYNSNVAELQTKLISLGYMVPVQQSQMGYFGVKTQAAVNSYKNANGLQNNTASTVGKVGDTTWAYIDRDYGIQQDVQNHKLYDISNVNSQFDNNLNAAKAAVSQAGNKSTTIFTPATTVSTPTASNQGASNSTIVNNNAANSNITAQSIINSIGLGAKDTITSNIQGLENLTTAEGWNNLATGMTPMGWASDDTIKKKLQMIDNMSNSIQTGYNEFIQGNWNVKAYYISRIGSEVVLTLVATKGAECATKVINLGETAEVTSVLAEEIPKNGTLSNVEARTWYLQQESKIPSIIDENLSLEEQAKQAVELRNQFRTQARDLMADRDLAVSLNKTDPNLTWEQVVKKYSEKGLQGDELYKEIINAAQRSRTSVNQSLGLK